MEPTCDVEQGGVADSIGNEGDLRLILADVGLADHQRVLGLALLN